MADLSMSTIRRYLDEMGFSDLSDAQVRMLRRDVIARLQDSEDAAAEVDFEAQEAGKAVEAVGSQRSAQGYINSGKAGDYANYNDQGDQGDQNAQDEYEEENGSELDNAEGQKEQESHGEQDRRAEQFRRDFAEGNMENLLNNDAGTATKKRARRDKISKDAAKDRKIGAAQSDSCRAAEVPGSDEERLARLYGGAESVLSASSVSEQIPEFQKARRPAYQSAGGPQNLYARQSAQTRQKTRPAARKPNSAASGVSGTGNGQRRGRAVGVAGVAGIAGIAGDAGSAPVRSAKADLLRDENVYDGPLAGGRGGRGDLSGSYSDGGDAVESDTSRGQNRGQKASQNPFSNPARYPFSNPAQNPLLDPVQASFSTNAAYSQTMRATGHTRINGLLGPHRYTLEEKKRRKADPVSNFAAYQQRWSVQGPPGERRQRAFVNRVREQGACCSASQRYYE